MNDLTPAIESRNPSPAQAQSGSVRTEAIQVTGRVAGPMAFLLLASSVAACGVDNPAYCDTPSDCEGGLSCDLDTNTCGTKLSVDPTGWTIDDQGRWWTVERAPVLRGTVEDPAFPTVQAYAAGIPVGPPAVVVGNTWEFALPDGVLSTTDVNPLEIRQTLAEGSLSAVVTIVSDPLAPTLSLTPPALYDERKDVITFGPNGPEHRRQGPRITPGTTCPTVGLYAYLHGMQPPAFGTESEANLLQFVPNVTSHPLSEPSLHWYLAVTAAGGDPEVTAAVTAVRNQPFEITAAAFPDFAKNTAQVQLNLVTRDWAGREVSATACWNQEGLATPLEVSSMNVGELGGWSLPLGSPISRLMNAAGPDVSVYERTLRQHTDQPIDVRVAFEPGLTQFRAQVKDMVLLTSSTPIASVCGTCNTDDCVPVPDNTDACTYEAPGSGGTARPPASGTADFGWGVTLYEDGTPFPCPAVGVRRHECTIPPRAPGGPPRTFRAVASITQVPGFGQPDFTEVTLAGRRFTGKVTRSGVVRCGNLDEDSVGPITRVICKQRDVYTYYSALDTGSLSFENRVSSPLLFEVYTRIDPQVPHTTPAHRLGLDITPFFWAAGNALLPGE